VSDDAELLAIGEVARQARMRPSRIRYYEDRGLLPAPQRVSGRRRYPPDVTRRLGMIDVAQRAGFSLDEIRQLLGPGDGPAHERLQRLARRKLPEIDTLIRQATAVRRWLEMTTACDCHSLDVCSLFDDRALELPAKRSMARVVVLGSG
jgi:DNA-binding transcriptional MerR regulator